VDVTADALTGLAAARLGLYVHFPYCLARCPYCDFAVAIRREVPGRAYADAVCAELSLRLGQAPSLAGRPLESVFIGGGTPSLWAPEDVARVLGHVRELQGIVPWAEVSLEANPEVADAGRFKGYVDAGINRLSLGVQSFQAHVLRTLGRGHTPEQAETAVRAARAAGAATVSVDLIYGAPGQTVEEVREDARRAVGLGVEHVSAYALTVEREVLAADTPFSKRQARGVLQSAEDALSVEMARALAEELEGAGLQRYEVSNFARPGRHSRHNALYWTGGEYLAAGVGATGLIGRRRYENERNSERYLQRVARGELPEASTEALSDEEAFHERLAMGLRLRTGIRLRAACEAHGMEAAPRLAEAERLVSGGFAAWEDERLRLTPRGLELHGEVVAKLM
jgi:oxygen-independent coproporphyrinogen-3 oxidase